MHVAYGCLAAAAHAMHAPMSFGSHRRMHSWLLLLGASPLLTAPPPTHTLPAYACRTIQKEVKSNVVGMLIAAVSVITSGAQQVMCGTVQRQHNVNGYQLLANTAHIQVGW